MKPPRNTPEQNNAAGSPSSGEPAFLAVGRLRRPHGVRGEMQMEVLTDFPERIQAGSVVYVGPNHRTLHIRSVRPHGYALLVAFNEFENPETVGELRNQVVYVPAADRPDLEEGEFYQHEILGLKVIDQEGQPVGVVSDILETGANDVFVVTPEQGADVLIPYIDEMVLEVRPAEGFIQVIMVPGLRGDEKDQ